MTDDPTQPIAVEARDGFCIWIQFQDGEAGEIDLSDLAVHGIFKAWAERSFFESVAINAYNEVTWGDQIDLCPDALYIQLTGKPVEEVMPGLSPTYINALSMPDSPHILYSANLRLRNSAASGTADTSSNSS